MINELEIKSADGLLLKGYFKNNSKSKILIFTHGISEYGLRHSYLFDLLSSHYNILVYDLRGHGRSEGERGFVKSFHEYENDLSLWIKSTQKQYPEASISLMGHSMGSLITMGAIHSQSNDLIRIIHKVFLSAPPLGVGDWLGAFLQNRISAHRLKKMGAILGKIPLAGSANTNYLSHDKAIQKSYINDPQILKKLSARLLLELLARGQEIKAEILKDEWKKKMKIVVGSLDKIVDVGKIKDYGKKNNSLNLMSVVNNGLHEMHFEIEDIQKEYFNALVTFFEPVRD